jgi:HEAT repeat protein
LPAPLAVLLCAGLGVAQDAGADKIADLRGKSIDARLAAIDWLATQDRKDAESLLLPLLADKDWEVQEHAAMAFGTRKAKAGVVPLVNLAVDGDVARVRQAAARALAAIDAADAAVRLGKQVKGKSVVPALEALALVLRAGTPFAEVDKLKKLVKDGDPRVREAAAAVVLEGAADRTAALRDLIAEARVGVVCRVLDAVAAAPRPADLEPLAARFAGAPLDDVVARRLLRALAVVLRTGAGDRAAAAKAVLARAGTEEVVLARVARLLPQITGGDNPVFDRAAAVVAIQPVLRASGASARAAAAKALREIGGDEALAAALAMFDRESDPRAALQLVETVAALRPPGPAAATQWLADIAKNGSMPEDVRERAIVRLGRAGVQGAVPALAAAAADQSWQVAVCAAVSLGKTDDERALPELTKLLADKDWKLRGAAAVGLMHHSREAVVEPLLGLLADAHPLVAHTAHEALRTLSRRYETPFEAKAWRTWWGEAKGKHDFTSREATLEKQKKYGYAVSDSDIYRGLDVVVLKSRGDHIEQLLDRLEIRYRATEAGQVPGAGLHPEAIFVANCTGELAPADVEPLEWFVRTGGSLFGSCWALTETIAKLEGGVVQKAATASDVLDNVRALPCRLESPLLTGVFPPAVVPIYHLEGAHLIQVRDPERCEVLIDSPDAAERHGCGNLAAWFFCGHGVLFDSANHFDLQGLGVATDLKTDKDRQAFAVDHLGLSLQNWRACRNESYWKSPSKAASSVADLSAFRLLTNFVRSKRMGEY